MFWARLKWWGIMADDHPNLAGYVQKIAKLFFSVGTALKRKSVSDSSFKHARIKSPQTLQIKI